MGGRESRRGLMREGKKGFEGWTVEGDPESSKVHEVMK